MGRKYERGKCGNRNQVTKFNEYQRSRQVDNRTQVRKLKEYERGKWGNGKSMKVASGEMERV